MAPALLVRTPVGSIPVSRCHESSIASTPDVGAPFLTLMLLSMLAAPVGPPRCPPPHRPVEVGRIALQALAPLMQGAVRTARTRLPIVATTHRAAQRAKAQSHAPAPATLPARAPPVAIKQSAEEPATASAPGRTRGYLASCWPCSIDLAGTRESAHHTARTAGSELPPQPAGTRPLNLVGAGRQELS